MKFPWTLIVVVVTGTAMASPPSPNCEEVHYVESWNHYTEGQVKSRVARLQLPFEAEVTPLVLSQIKMYVTAGRRETEYILGRMAMYQHIFEHYLQVYQLPQSLKYLPVIESGMRPSIRSSAGAVGMWQFMGSTARLYGLTINAYLDERLDPHRSTESAAKMLRDLHRQFGDWSLALAAYNCGPARVERAIQQARSRQFDAVKRYLPSETQRYIPAFVAAVYIAEHHRDHLLRPKLPAQQLRETRTLAVRQSLSFTEIGKATGVDHRILSRLNPAFRMGLIPVSRRGHYLVLPSAAMEPLKRHLNTKAGQNATQKAGPPESFRHTHIVASGDDIKKIARLFQVSVDDIVKWNGLAQAEVVVNQELDIYLSKSKLFNRA
jgi:membrane-bound lytic murein transglycosylase D